jgi:hypothetical protein
MKSRPTAITVISWLLVTMGILGVIGGIGAMNCHDSRVAVAVSNSPVPLPIQCAFSILGSGITAVCGLGMLKGHNWARLLYLVWAGVSLFVGLVASPDKLSVIPSVVLFALIAFFLFQPKTIEYFRPKPE